MDYIRKENNGVVVLQVNLVRATLKEAEEFKNILAKDITEDKKKIVIDLSSCDFIDSTFLGTLVISLKKATAVGGDIKLVGFKPAVRSMFELTRINKVFETFGSTDEASKSFQKT